MSRPLCLWAREGRAKAEAWLRQIIDQALEEAGLQESAPLAENPVPADSKPCAA